MYSYVLWKKNRNIKVTTEFGLEAHQAARL